MQHLPDAFRTYPVRRSVSLSLFLLVTVFVGSHPAWSQEILARQILSYGDSTVVTFEPPGAIPGEQLGLAFDARLDAKSWAGSNVALSIRLNGRFVSGDRLVNKPMTFATADGRLLRWANGDVWRLIYSPDFDQGRNAPGDPHQVLGSPPFHFEMWIGDLVRKDANRLVFFHVGRNLPPLEVRSVRLVAVEATAAKPAGGSKAQMGKIAAQETNRIVVPPPGAPPSGLILDPLAPGGGLRARFGTRAVRIATTVSIPGGGWRRLDEKGEGWGKLRASEKTLSAEAGSLRWTRSVRAGKGMIEVRDVVANRGRDDLGLIVRHALSRDPTSEVYLGGTLLPAAPLALSQVAPQAPSVAVVEAGATVGLLPANDVSWVQAGTFRDAQTAGFSDASLCVAAGDSVVLAWRAIATTGGYFDWLNAARASLEANFTLEGGFAFGTFEMARWPAEKLRDWIRMRGLRFISSPAPTSSNSTGLHSTALLDAPPALEKMRSFAAAVHRAVPDVKVIAYFHAFICNRSGALQRYSATGLKDQNGEPVYYPYAAGPKNFPLFVPVAGSEFARDLDTLVEKILELGFDGLYWDELSYSATPWTYGAWDGVSADVDPVRQTLVRRKAAVPLLAQPWIDATLTRLERDGHPIVGNTEPVTVTLQRHHFPRFVESSDDAQLPFAQLWSPIALGDRFREKSASDVAARIRAHLDDGLLYYFYHPAIQLQGPLMASCMYPTTPVRIDAGMVLATERILTRRSGTYGWNDASTHEVHVYGADGCETTSTGRSFEEGGIRWTTLDLAPDQCAAIVRRR